MEAINTENRDDMVPAEGWAQHVERLSLDNATFEANWCTRKRMSDAQWTRVMSALPGRVGVRALNGGNARRFVEAVLWMAHTRAYWSDIPAEYGAWHAIYIRFGRWAHDGIWSAVISAMQGLPDTQSRLDAMVEKYLASHQLQRLRGKMK